MKEHDDLRKLAAQLEETLGPAVGAGWDDCSRCDLARLKATQERLSKELLAHEDEEKRALTKALQAERGDPGEFGREIERSHKTLAHLIGLMSTVSTLYDGSHAYALRAAVSRVREELVAHLAREEKTLFPLLNQAKHKRVAPKPA